jgi:transposase
METVHFTTWAESFGSMEVGMPEIKYCVGIDIASDTFTASVGQIPWKLVIKPETFENAEDGYCLLLEWLEKHHLPAAETIVCMEATGV